MSISLTISLWKCLASIWRIRDLTQSPFKLMGVSSKGFGSSSRCRNQRKIVTTLSWGYCWTSGLGVLVFLKLLLASISMMHLVVNACPCLHQYLTLHCICSTRGLGEAAGQFINFPSSKMTCHQFNLTFIWTLMLHPSNNIFISRKGMSWKKYPTSPGREEIAHAFREVTIPDFEMGDYWTH